MAVPVASETGQGLDERDALQGRWPEAWPVAAAENADNGPTDRSGEVHRPGIMAHVELGFSEKRGKHRKFAVLAEPHPGPASAQRLHVCNDFLHGLGLGRVGHEKDGDLLLGLEPDHEFGKAFCRPGLDRDIGEAAREHRRPFARGEA